MFFPPFRNLWKILRWGSYFVKEDEVFWGLWIKKRFLVLFIPLFHSMGFFSLFMLLFSNDISILWYHGCILFPQNSFGVWLRIQGKTIACVGNTALYLILWFLFVLSALLSLQVYLNSLCDIWKLWLSIEPCFISIFLIQGPRSLNDSCNTIWNDNKYGKQWQQLHECHWSFRLVCYRGTKACTPWSLCFFSSKLTQMSLTTMGFFLPFL